MTRGKIPLCLPTADDHRRGDRHFAYRLWSIDIVAIRVRHSELNSISPAARHDKHLVQKRSSV